MGSNLSAASLDARQGAGALTIRWQTAKHGAKNIGKYTNELFMNPLLSVVIPTRNRSTDLKRLLDQLVGAVRDAHAQDVVEVCCVDNFSSDNTAAIIKEFERHHGFVHYHKQVISKPSAEESMTSAVGFAKGQYVWTLGDDDSIADGAFDELLPHLRTSRYKLLLLNCNIRPAGTNTSSKYIDVNSNVLYYEKGLDFFGDFGFVTATTTISCLCFDRMLFLKNDWGAFHRESPIYSHSFGLFAAFKDHPALFVNAPLVTYQMSAAKDEASRIFRLAAEQGRYSFYSFTAGLIRLINFTSRLTGVPASWFFSVSEIELAKDSLVVSPARLGSFVFRMLCNQLILSANENKLHQPISEDDWSILSRFFQGSPLETEFQGLYRVFGSAVIRLERGDPNDLTEVVKNTLSIIKIMDIKYFLLKSHESRSVLFFQNNARPFWASGKTLAVSASQERADSERPLISILVPTYNRSGKLLRLLGSLYKNELHLDPCFEIVCVDNKSSDLTPKVCEFWKKRIRNLVIHRREVHLPTAEQNINSAVEWCHGTFVWVLGDDDKVIFENVPFLKHCVELFSADYFLFNFQKEKVFSPGLPPISACQPVLRPGVPFKRSSVAELVARFGFTTSCACISATVFRRTIFRRFDDLIEISPIYSHVAAHMRSVPEDRAIFINLPLITYVDALDHVERFESFAAKSKSPFFYPWTIGLLSLLLELENKHIVDPMYFFRIVEKGNGGEYLLSREVLAQFLRQLIVSLKTKRLDNLFSEIDSERFLSFYERCPNFQAVLPEIRAGLVRIRSVLSLYDSTRGTLVHLDVRNVRVESQVRKELAYMTRLLWMLEHSASEMIPSSTEFWSKYNRMRYYWVDLGKAVLRIPFVKDFVFFSLDLLGMRTKMVRKWHDAKEAQFT